MIYKVLHKIFSEEFLLVQKWKMTGTIDRLSGLVWRAFCFLGSVCVLSIAVTNEDLGRRYQNTHHAHLHPNSNIKYCFANHIDIYICNGMLHINFFKCFNPVGCAGKKAPLSVFCSPRKKFKVKVANFSTFRDYEYGEVWASIHCFWKPGGGRGKRYPYFHIHLFQQNRQPK